MHVISNTRLEVSLRDVQLVSLYKKEKNMFSHESNIRENIVPVSLCFRFAKHSRVKFAVVGACDATANRLTFVTYMEENNIRSCW